MDEFVLLRNFGKLYHSFVVITGIFDEKQQQKKKRREDREIAITQII